MGNIILNKLKKCSHPVFLYGFLFCGMIMPNKYLKAQAVYPNLNAQQAQYIQQMQQKDHQDQIRKQMDEDVSKERYKEFLKEINMKRNSTLAGSWDVTKLKEGGYSATPYNGYSGLNLGFYTAQAIAFFLMEAMEAAVFPTLPM